VQYEGSRDIVERVISEWKRPAQFGHLQVGVVTEPAAGHLQHPGAFVDAGHVSHDAIRAALAAR
jgi:hypothetical protein